VMNQKQRIGKGEQERFGAGGKHCKKDRKKREDSKLTNSKCKRLARAHQSPYLTHYGNLKNTNKKKTQPDNNKKKTLNHQPKSARPKKTTTQKKKKKHNQTTKKKNSLNR